MPTFPTMTSSIPHWLSLEIAKRMEEKLSIIKLSPQHIFQSGSLHPEIIYQRYPKAINYCSDVRFRQSIFRNLFLKLSKRPAFKFALPADEALRHSMDLVWSNLELHIHSSPESLITAWEKLLKPEALLMFSYLGPDTGKELRQIAGLVPSLSSSWDMHDVGDALGKSGFAEPVMDMEYITLKYDNHDLLLKDIVELGLSNDGLMDKKQVFELKEPLQLTLELVYGHAWMPKQRLSKSNMGVATIEIDQIIRQKN
jgi:malonyl-CoA O-methyltransferase